MRSGLVLNTEETDALWLQGHDFVGLLVCWVGYASSATFSRPLELIFRHRCIILVIGESALSDLHINLSSVVGGEDTHRILLEIKHWCLCRRSIKQVSQVLDADEHSHSVERQQVDLQVTVEIRHIDLGGGALRTNLVLAAQRSCNKESDWFVDSELDPALQRLLRLEVEELEEVASVDLDTHSLWSLCLVQSFTDATTIVMLKSAILQELNAAVGKH